MNTKAVIKQMMAVCFLGVLFIIGMQIPISATTTEERGQYRTATPSDASEKDDSFENEFENDLENEFEKDPEAGADNNALNPGLTAPPIGMPEPDNIMPMIIDTTEPVVTRARLLTTEVSYPGHITLELDIVEDGYGVQYIGVADGRNIFPLAHARFAQPLFTGTHIVNLDLREGAVEAGQEYEIGGLLIDDGFYIERTYSIHDEENWPFKEPAVFTVTSDSSIPPTPSIPTYRLNDVRFLSQEVHVSEYLKAEIDMGDIGTGVRLIRFVLQDQNEPDREKDVFFDPGNSGAIASGTNTIAIDIGELPAGTYDLTAIELIGYNTPAVHYFKGENGRYDPEDVIEPWVFGDIDITVTGELDPGPVVNHVNILNTSIKAPGTIDLEMGITAGNGGVRAIELTLEYKDGGDRDYPTTTVLLPERYGDKGEIMFPDQSTVQTGNYVMRFPIPLDMLPDTDYYIISVEVRDRADQYKSYYGHDEGTNLSELPPIRLTRANYAIETSVWNPELLTLIPTLPEGSEVLLDGKLQGIIPAALFRAAAGRDITIHIEMEGDPNYLEALYTFNGKEISAAKARDVNINFAYSFANGQEYGITDDTVYLLKLDDRGGLPGPITLRLPTASLLMIEDSYNRGAMYLSRLSGTRLMREGVVSEAADGYTDIVLTYGADYVLSKTEPSYENSGDIPGDTGGTSGGASSGSSRDSSDGRSDTGYWKHDENGWWYQYYNGSYPESVWKLIRGDWYYFEDSGYMATGWKLLNGKWYWMDPGTGRMVANNWVLDRDNWYYLGSDGAMVTGWIIYKDAYYYLSEVPGSTYGRMFSDEDTPDGYRVDPNGMWIR